MGGPSPIPAPKSDDDEDVSWALSTASALWGRGESSEALKWLRRAAETASDANRDLRAVELFKAAAELANDVDRSKSIAPPAPAQSTPPPPAVAMHDAAQPGEPVEKMVSPSRRPPPPPRRAGSLSGASEPPPPMPQMPVQEPARGSALPPMPAARTPMASQPPARPASIAPQSPSHAPPSPSHAPTPTSAQPHVLNAVAPLVSPMGRNPQNLPQRKQPVIVPPVVASASAALRRASMPSIPSVDPKISAAPDRASGAPSPSRDSVHDDPPTKQMTAQQAASLSRRARTASRTKGLVSLAHGGAQQKERTRTKTERGERQIADAASSAPEPPPSAAKTLKRAVSEATEEMPAMHHEHAEKPAVRTRREDEITVVRLPFPKPDAKRAAELASLAGSFDDEQTNVLAGDEAFVDFKTDNQSAPPKSTRPDAVAAAAAAAAPPATNTQPSRTDAAHASTASAYTAIWSAFRVGLVADATGLRLVPARDGAPSAFLVPADSASADAIARLLETQHQNGREP